MGGISKFRDSGKHMVGIAIHDAEVITAGAGNDNVEVSGNYVSRKGANGSEVPLSGKLIISFKAVLAEDKTLTIAANLQDAVDAAGVGVADYGNAFASAIVATGGSGGSKDQTVIRAIAEHDFNIRHLESLAIMTEVKWLL